MIINHHENHIITRLSLTIYIYINSILPTNGRWLNHQPEYRFMGFPCCFLTAEFPFEGNPLRRWTLVGWTLVGWHSVVIFWWSFVDVWKNVDILCGRCRQNMRKMWMNMDLLLINIGFSMGNVFWFADEEPSPSFGEPKKMPRKYLQHGYRWCFPKLISRKLQLSYNCLEVENRHNHIHSPLLANQQSPSCPQFQDGFSMSYQPCEDLPKDRYQI